MSGPNAVGSFGNNTEQKAILEPLFTVPNNQNVMNVMKDPHIIYKYKVAEGPNEEPNAGEYKIQTLEGPAKYKDGDYIMTGVIGEKWNVGDKNKFNTKYTLPKGTPEGTTEGICTVNPESAGRLAMKAIDLPIKSGQISAYGGWNVLNYTPESIIIRYSEGEYGVIHPTVFNISYLIQDNNGNFVKQEEEMLPTPTPPVTENYTYEKTVVDDDTFYGGRRTRRSRRGRKQSRRIKKSRRKGRRSHRKKH